MRSLVLVSIIAFMAGSLGLYAQGKDTAQAEIKLVLIWEKEFKEEIINVAFSEEKTMVITKDKVFSLDNATGETKFLRPTYQGGKNLSWRRTWVYPSKNGKYIGFYHHVYFDEYSQKFKTRKKRLAVFELIDNSGNRIWHKEKEVRSEEEFYAPSLTVSNKGYVVETDLDWHGKLYFYDPSGKMIKEVKVSENQFENCVTHGETWSDDGEYFAIFTDEGIKSNDNRTYIKKYNKLGSEIWSYFEGGKNIFFSECEISTKGKKLAVMLNRSSLYLFGKKGEKPFVKALGHGFYILRFANQDKLLILAESGIKKPPKIICLKMSRNRELLWRRAFSEGDRIERIFSYNNYIIIQRKAKFSEQVLDIINKKGEIILSIALAEIPEIDKNRKVIEKKMIRNDNKLYLLTILTTTKGG